MLVSTAEIGFMCRYLVFRNSLKQFHNYHLGACGILPQPQQNHKWLHDLTSCRYYRHDCHMVSDATKLNIMCVTSFFMSHHAFWTTNFHSTQKNLEVESPLWILNIDFFIKTASFAKYLPSCFHWIYCAQSSKTLLPTISFLCRYRKRRHFQPGFRSD